MDSKLQIISGMFRGRKLRLPNGARPTQNRARIALFNMLDVILPNCPGNVWDAFAGSGAFGIECLSRFPDCRVVFTDIAPKTVRENLAALSIGARASVLAGDAMSYVAKYGATSDLVFVDPPYAAADTGVEFVRQLGNYVRPGAVVIWEQDDTTAVIPDENVWNILRDKRYGRARFFILQKK